MGIVDGDIISDSAQPKDSDRGEAEANTNTRGNNGRFSSQGGHYDDIGNRNSNNTLSTLKEVLIYFFNSLALNHTQN